MYGGSRVRRDGHPTAVWAHVEGPEVRVELGRVAEPRGESTKLVLVQDRQDMRHLTILFHGMDDVKSKGKALRQIVKEQLGALEK